MYPVGFLSLTSGRRWSHSEATLPQYAHWNVSGVILSSSKASLTSSALGGTTGIIELMNAFVILEERPVIFIGVGIRNSEKYSIVVAL